MSSVTSHSPESDVSSINSAPRPEDSDVQIEKTQINLLTDNLNSNNINLNANNHTQFEIINKQEVNQNEIEKN